MSLAQDLLWLCSIPSLIGEEKALCDAVQARLGRSQLAAPIRRYGDSIVVPVRRGCGGPHVVLGGHLDVVRTEHEGVPRIEGGRVVRARRGRHEERSCVDVGLDRAPRGRGRST